MSTEQVDLKDIPGIDVIQARLALSMPVCRFLPPVLNWITWNTFWNFGVAQEQRSTGLVFQEHFWKMYVITALLRVAGILRNCTLSLQIRSEKLSKATG